jgi:hypothetical protein
MLKQYDLPFNPVPLPEPGQGGIFISKKYDLWVTSVSTFILLVVILFIYLAERKVHRLGTDVVPSTVISPHDKRGNDAGMEI